MIVILKIKILEKIRDKKRAVALCNSPLNNILFYVASDSIACKTKLRTNNPADTQSTGEISLICFLQILTIM